VKELETKLLESQTKLLKSQTKLLKSQTKLSETKTELLESQKKPAVADKETNTDINDLDFGLDTSSEDNENNC
jgi:hypothetical protein